MGSENLKGNSFCFQQKAVGKGEDKQLFIPPKYCEPSQNPLKEYVKFRAESANYHRKILTGWHKQVVQ